MTYKYSQQKTGFVLLFAVLLVSVVLTISLSLLNITYKQIILSATSKDSQIANFTATSALGCALFWDRYDDISSDDADTVTINNYPFGLFDINSIFVPPQRNNIKCTNDNLINITRDDTDPNFLKSYFEIEFRDQDGKIYGFATVEVIKIKNESRTLMKASGYNTRDPSSRRVERSYDAKFGNIDP